MTSKTDPIVTAQMIFNVLPFEIIKDHPVIAFLSEGRHLMMAEKAQFLCKNPQKNSQSIGALSRAIQF
jgi:hypothetical protein